MDVTVSDQELAVDGVQRVKLLFEYLGNYAKAQREAVTSLHEHEVSLEFPPQIGSSQWVVSAFQDSAAEEAPMLSVKKPNFNRCPAPDEMLLPWLADGWEDYRVDIRLKLPEHFEREFPKEEGERIDPLYALMQKQGLHPVYQAWSEERKAWQESQRQAQEALDLFTSLSNVYTSLQRDGDTLDLVAASMFFKRRDNGSVDHPIFLKRAAIQFDAENNIISIVDTENAPYLYEDLLVDLKDMDASAVRAISSEIHEECPHPFDRDVMPSFARRLIHGMSPRGQFLEDPSGYLNPNTEVLLYQRYALILMKKPSGTAQAIARVLEGIESGMKIPPHLLELVGARQERDMPLPTGEESPEQRLAATDGEDHDILLSKPANREQLEIARIIEKADAVLVQGPPGTGKTHTIANLLGHLLAQGKRVLITSSKGKALEVLKEKLSPEIAALCVAVTGDSNEDLERSVDAIIDKQSSTSLDGLSRTIQRLELERESIINELSRRRHRMFDVRKQEASTFVVADEEMTAIEVARDAASLKERGADLLVPGYVDADTAFPYSEAELAELYGLNAKLGVDDERLLPRLAAEWGPWSLPDSAAFQKMAVDVEELGRSIREKCERENWELVRGDSHYEVVTQWGRCCLPESMSIEDARGTVRGIQKMAIEDEWMIAAAADGARGAEHAELWNRLCTLLKETDDASSACRSELFGHIVSLGGREDYRVVALAAQDRLESLRKGKLANLISGLFSGGKKERLSGVTVDGEEPSDSVQLQMIVDLATLGEMRERCAVAWSQLVEANGGPAFESLDVDHPEHVASGWKDDINAALEWMTIVQKKLKQMIGSLGMSELVFPDLNRKLDEASNVKVISEFISSTLVELAGVLIDARKLDVVNGKRDNAIELIAASGVACEQLSDLQESLLEYDCEAYDRSCRWLASMDEKLEVLRSRDSLLARVEKIAPCWATAFRDKVAPHNSALPPAHLDEGWRYAQEVGFLNRIQREADGDLQQAVIELSENYRKITAELAANRAWYLLIQRLQGNIQLAQALNGWKGTVKQIGKGTGKRAPKLRSRARRQMAQCQGAVPAWVMCMSDVMNMLDPVSNHFDVLIVDEASQADVTALPLLCFADKVVIVGDDEQVNPISVGLLNDKVEALAEMSITGVIPNDNLYGPGSSLYDLAGTTFTRVMLKEHFRCVPDIIEFSNSLSYDHQIKVLRESNSTDLIPSVIEYRVEDGHCSRNGKTNEAEALAVVDVIEACLAQPEYQDKSFGVIAMKGREQGRLIEGKMFERFGLGVAQDHKLICGDPANFQGDERDVIILSLVDSNEGSAPLALRAEGRDNMLKKRYNVAASRAKDQLWVVHSLDPEFDLKSGDLRRRIIEHARDPHSYSSAKDQSETFADSPFEMEVATALRMKGYPIQQQYQVGSYRIDIAIVENDKRVAIECDGERWHSSDEQILNDMERQAILERLGWSFVRIRGSRYYGDKVQTICEVCERLDAMGVVSHRKTEKSACESDLLKRVMGKIDEIRESRPTEPVGHSLKNTRERRATIAGALSSKCESSLSGSSKARGGRSSNEIPATLPAKVQADNSKPMQGNQWGPKSDDMARKTGEDPEQTPEVRLDERVFDLSYSLDADCIPADGGSYLIVCGPANGYKINNTAEKIGYQAQYHSEGRTETMGRSYWAVSPKGARP